MARALEPMFLQDNKLTDFAKKDFCSAVQDILANGGPAGGPGGLKPCIKESPPEPAYENVDLCDPKQFPEFHKNMLPTYEKMLQTLNTEVSQPMLMATFIFDPTALAANIGITYDENNPMPELSDVLEATASPDKMMELLGIKLEDGEPPYADGAAALAVEIPKLISGLGAIPTPPEIPSISPDLFELGLDLDLGNTGLVTFQMNSFKAPVDAVLGLLGDLPGLAPFAPADMIDALCETITKALPPGDDDKAIEKASYRVMAERMITASAVCTAAMAMGAGGVIADSVYTGTGGTTPETLAERDERLKETDEEKNDIPRPIGADWTKGYSGRTLTAFKPTHKGVYQHGKQVIEWKTNGTGIKAETFQKIRDIGKVLIDGDTDLIGGELTDADKGLIVLCVLFHETGMDGCAVTAYKGTKYPYAYSDEFIWGFNTIANIGIQLYTSVTPKMVNTIPYYAPGVGMGLVQQLEYYEQFFTRYLSIGLTNNKGLGEKGKKNNMTSQLYDGLVPSHLEKLKSAYEGKKVSAFAGESPPGRMGIWENESSSTGPDFAGKPAVPKTPPENPYYMQNIYDLYAIHEGTAAAGPNYWAIPGGKVPYTLAHRTAKLISPAAMTGRIPKSETEADQGSILRDYMEAVGMSPDQYNWDKIIVGLQPYLEDNGMRVRLLSPSPGSAAQSVFPHGMGVPSIGKPNPSQDYWWHPKWANGDVSHGPLASEQPGIGWKNAGAALASFTKGMKDRETKKATAATFNPNAA